MITFSGFSPFADEDGTVTERMPIVAPYGAGKFLDLLARCIERTGDKAPLQAGPQSAPGAAYTPTPPEVDTAGEGTMSEAFRFVLGHEGMAYVRVDGGRESSRYGILQDTAERLGYTGSVKNMSQAEAAAAYRKLWAESGAEALPPRLAIVHFDTYMNSPAAARKILRSSGGDTEAYLRFRSERYVRLSELKPERYGRYLKGWMNRIDDLRAMATGAELSTEKAPA